MINFNLVNKFLGYFTKPDTTNALPGMLVGGSINVLINDQEKVAVRKGYTLYGAANTATTPIKSSFDWDNSSGNQINLREYNGNLEFYSSTSSAWETLLTGLSTTKPVRFTTWWSSTEVIDLLLFVNNSTTLYEWSGATTTFASAAATTITKQGAGTWAASRFLTAGSRSVRIKDTGGTWREFSYTGGETTTTLTGISPDPTAFTFDAGAIVAQMVRSNASTPASTFTNDIIEVLNNQVYVGSHTSREIRVSKNTSITDYTFSTPRVPGEGATLTLDGYGVGFVVQEQDVYIASGKSDWYKTNFELQAGSTADREVLSVKKLKTTPLMAAQSQELIGRIGNAVAFVSNEPALRLLSRVENLEEPQFTSVSNPIKPDFDDETWTNGHLYFFKNRVHVSAPSSDRVYIWEVRENPDGSTSKFWQPPQVLPIRRFANIGGILYGHSGRVPETYKLFDGTNDNALNFKANATFAYQSYGKRPNLKNFDEVYTEGYISANTKLTLRLNFDYQGFTQQLEATVDGQDDTILFQPIEDDSLGNSPMADVSLTGDILTSLSVLSKFRVINTFPRTDCYELQFIYETDSTDAQWELLAFGSNTILSRHQSIDIKK